MKIAYWLLLLLLIFSGCKKDSNEIENQQPYGTSPAIHYIDSVFTFTPQSGTNYVEFDYAANGDVIRKSVTGGLYYTFQDIGLIKKQYTYNSLNQIMDSAIYFLNSKKRPDSALYYWIPPLGVDTFYFKYDQEGHLTYHKQININSDVSTYTYQDHNIVKYKRQYGSNIYEENFFYDYSRACNTNFELNPGIGGFSMFTKHSLNLINGYQINSNGVTKNFTVLNSFDTQGYLIKSIIIDSASGDTTEIRSYTY